MAMNNTNYGYSPSSYSSPFSPLYSSPYSSTPAGVRPHRPRFGFSGPPMYPRPRSSASKPNPDSFSESMINNYGSSSSRIDTSFNSENGSSYDDNSNYYTASESFYTQDVACEDRDVYNSPVLVRKDRSLGRGDMQNAGILPDPNSQFITHANVYNPTPEMNNTDFKGNFQKNSAGIGFGDKSKRKFSKAKRMTTKNQQGNWRCELCSLDFTSQIPYDMHLRGARHAKKVKAKDALSTVQLQDVKQSEGDKTFFCELCNVRANSTLQLQTHLEGSKHKNKLQPKEPKDQEESSKESTKTETKASENGKSNGSLTRPLPADFGEPQPSKLAKFACDVCGIIVNSEIQLQQHLSSKKHQNKLEGKPVIKTKKIKLESKTETQENVEEANTNLETAPSEPSAKVVGVKTLASSFVQGETLQ